MIINTYEIFDVRKGLSVDPQIIKAKTPVDAVKKAGYKYVARDFAGKKEIVVTNIMSQRTYMYVGEMRS